MTTGQFQRGHAMIIGEYNEYVHSSAVTGEDADFEKLVNED
jgi:hypothetical protein